MAKIYQKKYIVIYLQSWLVKMSKQPVCKIGPSILNADLSDLHTACVKVR